MKNSRKLEKLKEFIEEYTEAGKVLHSQCSELITEYFSNIELLEDMYNRIEASEGSSVLSNPEKPGNVSYDIRSEEFWKIVDANVELLESEGKLAGVLMPTAEKLKTFDI